MGRRGLGPRVVVVRGRSWLLEGDKAGLCRFFARNVVDRRTGVVYAGGRKREGIPWLGLILGGHHEHHIRSCFSRPQSHAPQHF